MEMVRDCEQKSLITELTQGKELVNQLKNQLDPPCRSRDTCELLVDQIISSYDKAISLLKLGDPRLALGMLESPNSFACASPTSQASDPADQYHKHVSKKRKTLPQWTDQVRVCSGAALEGSLDDGYSWRKYGQKEILGANFPRAYYRCTHRNAQGCLATKQVQRSDQDASVFEISYRGRHTCIQSSHLNQALATSKREGRKPSQHHSLQLLHQEKQEQSQEMILNSGSCLKVKNEELSRGEDTFLSFSFPSTPIESEDLETNIFGEAMKANDFMGTYSPNFISPATSESNFFSLLPCHMSDFGMGYNLQSSDSDLTEIISAPTSVTNSPIGDLDFSLDQVAFDPNFPFDTSEFFT
ncbi:probable WRKY transcription factor 53 [Cornus florida]|uniref:probable WRKY transcription factor 53 n=1 Tax=Cornus florida TaxID=4283 RepID=UPI00289C7202|nr:probable WRKY transcription factor 53 [Cornus florida]